MDIFYLLETEDQLQYMTGLNHDGIWEAGVCLDDWDYFIVIPTKDKPGKFARNIIPKNDTWNRLLDGCFSNDWVHIESPNGYFYIGGAYHS